MKLGDVLKKERERVEISAQEMAAHLSLDKAIYEALESGNSSAETWGAVLADLAIALEVPVARLLSESGRSRDIEPGGPASLITEHRQRQGIGAEELAAALGLTVDQLHSIEAGESPLADIGSQLLAFAETIEQPVFNLFYPCGLPFQELDDYP